MTTHESKRSNVPSRFRPRLATASLPALLAALGAALLGAVPARAQQTQVTAEERAQATLDGIEFILKGGIEFENRPPNRGACVSCHVTAQAVRAGAFADANGYQLTANDKANLKGLLDRFQRQQKSGPPAPTQDASGAAVFQCSGLAGAIAHPNVSGNLHPNQTSGLAAVALAAFGKGQPLVTDDSGHTVPQSSVTFPRDNFLRLARYLGCAQQSDGKVPADWPNSQHRLTGWHVSTTARSVIVWARAAEISDDPTEKQAFSNAINKAVPYLRNLSNLASGNEQFQEKAWIILALRAAGFPTQDPLIEQLRDDLLAAYHVSGGYGGWSWTGSTTAGIDTFGTGFTISALLQAGVPPSDARITQGIATLVRKQTQITVRDPGSNAIILSGRGWTDGPFGGTGVTDSTWPVIALSEIPVFTLDFITPGDFARLPSGDGVVHPIVVRGPTDLDPPYTLTLTVDGVELARKTVTSRKTDADRTLSLDWDVTGLSDGVHTIVAHGEIDATNPLFNKVGIDQRSLTIVREVILGDVIITDFSADPNPFKPSDGTNFRVEIAAGKNGADLTLEIFETARDALGVPQLVEPPIRTITSSGLGFGRHGIRWDGKDDAGKTVPDGLYVVRARAVEVVDEGGTSRTITDERSTQLIGGFQSYTPPVVEGTLRAENGKVPLGAVVQLVTPAGGVFQSIPVPETGTFRFNVLELGTYTVVGTAPGHEPDVRSNVALETEGQTHRFDFTVYLDRDGDGLSYGQETKLYGTDPNKADTDGDGLSDGAEVSGDNPRKQTSDPLKVDTDGDGLTDAQEIRDQCTDPRQADTDGDGLRDPAEIFSYGTDPCNADTDGDGLSDGDEILRHRTDPRKADTDGDGLSDGDEVLVHGSDPTRTDTDGDGFPDNVEVAEGSDPSDPTKNPPRAPIAADTTVTVLEDTPTSFSPTASDPNRDSLDTVWDALPTAGTLQGDGLSFVYTPPADRSGTFTATFHVTDGTLSSGQATVTFIVQPVNDPPAAQPIADVTVPEDSGEHTVTIAGIVAGPDDESGQSVAVSAQLDPQAPIVLTKANATAAAGNATIAFSTRPDAYGSAVVTLTLTDSEGARATLRFTVHVTPADDPPVPQPAHGTVAEDDEGVITLAATDPEGAALTFAVGSAPSHGQVRIRENVAIYRPEPDFHGTDSFGWTVSDGVNVVRGLATVEVTPRNDPPRFVLDPTMTVAEDAGPSHFEIRAIDGGPLEPTDVVDLEVQFSPDGVLALDTPRIASAGSNALVAFHTLPDVTGSVTVRVVATDAAGARTEHTATLTVLPVNDPPTAADTSATTDEDQAVVVALPVDDVDGDPLTVAIDIPPSHGTATVEGLSVRYTPAPDYHGDDSVGFTVADPAGERAAGTLRLTVRPVQDAPRLTAASATVRANESVEVDLSGHAVDPDGDALGFEIAQPPAHGTATLQGTRLTYTPAQGFTGTDRLSWRAVDPAGNAGVNELTVTVTPYNHAPVASTGAFATDEDTPASFDLSTLVSDVDGDAITLRLQTMPARGTLLLRGNTVEYTPAADDTGSVRFTYLASDGALESAPAEVTITIRPRNDAPIAAMAALPAVLETDRTGGVGVQLDASGSSDPDGDPLTFSWTGPFGTVAGEQVAVVLPLGRHTIALEVRDPDGATSRVETTLEVVGVAARIEVSANAATDGEVDTWVPVEVQVTDAYGNALEGEDVRFAAGAGASVETDRGSTDANGRVATRLRLGTLVGDYEAIVTLAANPAVERIHTVRAHAAAVARLVLQNPPPARVSADTPFGLDVRLEDAFGNRHDGAPTPVRASLASATGGQLSGTLEVTSDAGVARFTALRYDHHGEIRIRLEAPGTSAAAVETGPIFVVGSEDAIVLGHGTGPDGVRVVDPGVVAVGIAGSNLGNSTVLGVDLERAGGPAGGVALRFAGQDATVAQQHFATLAEAETQVVALSAGDHVLRWSVQLDPADPALVTTPDGWLTREEVLRVRAIPPVARAVAPAWLPVGGSALLDGRGSTDRNGDTLQFRWEVLDAPAGLTVTFDDAHAASTLVRAAGTGEGYVRLRLTVDDGTAQDSAEFDLFASASAPPPVAEAGFDRVTEVGEPVALDGRGSRGFAAPLRYRWSTLDASGNEVANVLDGADLVQPAFVPSAPGVYRFGLEVIDARGVVSERDTVQVTVTDPDGTAPVAALARRVDPPADRAALVDEPVRLEALAPAGASPALRWRQVAGPDLALGMVAGDTLSFRAALPGSYAFELETEDAAGSILRDTIAVQVRAADATPLVLDAQITSGLDPASGRAQVGDAIELAARLLEGAGGVEVAGARYGWHQIAGPPAALEDADRAAARWRPRVAGNYVFACVASAPEPLDGAHEVAVPVQRRLTVTVDAANDRAPVLHVESDPPPAPGQEGLVVLEGSEDPDGQALTYVFEQVRDEAPRAQIRESAPGVFVVLPPAEGTYRFAARVVDASGRVSPTEEVVFAVTASVGGGVAGGGAANEQPNVGGGGGGGCALSSRGAERGSPLAPFVLLLAVLGVIRLGATRSSTR